MCITGAATNDLMSHTKYTWAMWIRNNERNKKKIVAYTKSDTSLLQWRNIKPQEESAEEKKNAHTQHTHTSSEIKLKRKVYVSDINIMALVNVQMYAFVLLHYSDARSLTCISDLIRENPINANVLRIVLRHQN